MTGFIILLVEDDPDDVFFLKDAFARAGLGAALRVARDGEEAVAYLRGDSVHADRALHPLPSLVLLDLKLPRKSGLEVLAWCRQQPGLKRIPIVVLTSSLSGEDIAQAYDLGASAYLVKPLEADAQLEMVKTIRAFWVDLNKTAKNRAPAR